MRSPQSIGGGTGVTLTQAIIALAVIGACTVGLVFGELDAAAFVGVIGPLAGVIFGSESTRRTVNGALVSAYQAGYGAGVQEVSSGGRRERPPGTPPPPEVVDP